MIYLITYDKGKAFGNYDNLESAIQRIGPWWHHMKNTWLVNSQLHVNEVYNQLAPHLDTDDRIIVIQVASNYQGWLDEEAWKWINNQFGRGF